MLVPYVHLVGRTFKSDDEHFMFVKEVRESHHNEINQWIYSCMLISLLTILSKGNLCKPPFDMLALGYLTTRELDLSLSLTMCSYELLMILANSKTTCQTWMQF